MEQNPGCGCREVSSEVLVPSLTQQRADFQKCAFLAHIFYTVAQAKGTLHTMTDDLLG